jgi:hypothetical protein
MFILLLSLYCVDVGSVVNVSDVYAVSIFRVKLSRVGVQSINRFHSKITIRRRAEVDAMFRPTGTADRETS